MSNPKRDRKRKRNVSSPVFRFLRFFSSIRFGIYLLIALGVLSLVGMLVVQQNVEGFAAFYADLGPYERSVLEWLGVFDIYHSWYYRLLLAALSLNIIMSAIDRLPGTWKLITQPNITMAPGRLEAQTFFKDYFLFTGDAESAATAAANRFRKRGFRDIRTETAGSARFVFAQKAAWNRLGGYAVHVALLLILFGGFLTSWSAQSGEMALAPGMTADRIETREALGDMTRRVTAELPFKIYCRDIRQKLIDSRGSIRPSNTLDWVTEITIIEGEMRTDASVSLNSPIDYEGYRIFHSSVVPLGRARTIRITATPEIGEPETISLNRGGTATLSDGTKVEFVSFRAGFDMKSEDPTGDTSDYESPAAVLEVTPPGGKQEPAFAFGGLMAEMPVAKQPVAGYTFRVVDFEKVADRHILFIRRDPGQPLLYAGFGLLVISLLGVFLFSHRRIWFRVDGEAEGIRVRLAGETNRPYDTFGSAFDRIASEIYDDLYRE